MAVYPLQSSPFATKIWQNAFRTVPDISFLTPKKICRRFLSKNNSLQNQLIDVLEELRWFERHRHVRRQKLLPVVRLFSLCDPWRRGKSGTPCFLG